MATMEDGTVLQEGDVIQAYWKGGRRLYTGTISYIHDNGTLDISYHDGDKEEGVSGMVW